MAPLQNAFDYLVWNPIYETEKPFQVYSDIPPDAEDQRQSNLKFETASAIETIHDVRGQESLFTLDRHGFQYIKHTSKVSGIDFRDSTAVEEKYLPECQEVLKQELHGVDEILLFDWRVRCSDTAHQHGKQVDYNDKQTVFGPVKTPHIDTSPGYVIDVIERNFPDRAEFLLRGRVRWINASIDCYPLAISDGTTEHIKWYYMSRQTPVDLLIFKNFDSQEGVAPYALHSAVTSGFEGNQKPRESVEVRMMVFTYPEE